MNVEQEAMSLCSDIQSLSLVCNKISYDISICILYFCRFQVSAEWQQCRAQLQVSNIKDLHMELKSSELTCDTCDVTGLFFGINEKQHTSYIYHIETSVSKVSWVQSNSEFRYIPTYISNWLKTAALKNLSFTRHRVVINWRMKSDCWFTQETWVSPFQANCLSELLSMAPVFSR